MAGDADAETVIELDAETWQGLVHELEAPAGLLYARARALRARHAIDASWRGSRRCARMYNGRPLYDAGDARRCATATGARSIPRAASRSPTTARRWRTSSHVAGYLLRARRLRGGRGRGVPQPRREALRGEARKGDKLSWWGKNARRRGGALPRHARRRQAAAARRCRRSAPARARRISPTSRSSTAAARARASP